MSELAGDPTCSNCYRTVDCHRGIWRRFSCDRCLRSAVECSVCGGVARARNYSAMTLCELCNFSDEVGDAEIVPRTDHRTRYGTLIRELALLPVDLSDDEPWTEAYVRARLAIRRPEELKNFTARWRPIWQIAHRRNWMPSREEVAIATEAYDATKALRCLRRFDLGMQCGHHDAEVDCAGANIFAPELLVKCHELAVENQGTPNQVLLGIADIVAAELTN